MVMTREFDYADALGALLKPYLPGGYPSARLAASLMDTSERTLARRLAQRGLRYQAVIDKLRFQRARNLLRDTVEPINEIARGVGFDDPAHFARMFHRIAGVSPRAFRRMARRGA